MAMTRARTSGQADRKRGELLVPGRRDDGTKRRSRPLTPSRNSCAAATVAWMCWSKSW
jgi:hypothetical protein